MRIAIALDGLAVGVDCRRVPTTTYLLAWLRAFVFTQLVEVPIYRFGLRASWKDAFAASAITHPIVWFVFFGPLGGFSDYELRMTGAELFAWLAEAAFLGRNGRWRAALGWALVANVASAGLGTAIRALTGYP